MNNPTSKAPLFKPGTSQLCCDLLPDYLSQGAVGITLNAFQLDTLHKCTFGLRAVVGLLNSSAMLRSLRADHSTPDEFYDAPLSPRCEEGLAYAADIMLDQLHELCDFIQENSKQVAGGAV
jgi:hypothetical protein